MLVICEDCAKKYNIDESRIKGRRARFTCNECGHIIIVDKEDLIRPLFSGAPTAAASPTIDLLQEMQKPLDAAAEPGSPAYHSEQRQIVRRKNRGLPVFFYFIAVMLFALICVSVVTGYLYSEYLYTQYLAEAYNRAVDQRPDIMIESSLIFGAAWLVILLFIVALAGYLHRKFRYLVKNANQLAAGDYDLVIVKNGPREVRDLAYSLERIRLHLKTLV